MKIILFCLVLVACAPRTDSVAEPNALVVPGDGTVLLSANSGRLGIGCAPGAKDCAIDIWPHDTNVVTPFSLSEITIHRDNLGAYKMERLNISAMPDDSEDGAYRIGVEAGGIGRHRDIIFCFEAPQGLPANCPFKITPYGVFISDNGGASWIKLTGGKHED